MTKSNKARRVFDRVKRLVGRMVGLDKAQNEIKSLKGEVYNERSRHMNAEADLKRQLKLVTSQRDSWIACAEKHGYSNTTNDQVQPEKKRKSL